ncbi:PDZ domain-containing protein [Planctomicrobium sp. SH527]|uniref:PDZ domain-containing protein n=1 Tax=Planctomicrobium sp. SH527 TaxID=3448123 RepID=UPI003F5B14AE
MFSRTIATCFLVIGLTSISTAFAKESALHTLHPIDHLSPHRLPVIESGSSGIAPSQSSLVPTARLEQQDGPVRFRVAQPNPAPDPDSEPRLGIVTVPAGGIGQRIISVTPNSPAMRIRFTNGQASYLEPNDIIVNINGVPANNRSDYLVALFDAPPGTLQFTIQNSRNGRIYACTTTLGGGGGGTTANRIGVTVSDQTGGVEVVTVNSNSPATRIVLSDGSRATLSSGDLFLTINGRAITTVSEFDQALSSSPKDMQFTFRRYADQRVLTATAQLSSGSGGTTTGTRFGAYVTSQPGGGVKVTAVMANTPARRVDLDTLGIRSLEPGDIITHVNGIKITDEQHYRQEVQNSPQHMHFNLINIRNGASYSGHVNLRY